MTTEFQRIALFLVCAVPMLAQIGGGSVVGLVSDQSGAAVPNATVKITNILTNVSSKSTTNQAGHYEFPLLPAGSYVIDIQAQGFSATKTNEFVLNAGTRPRFDLTLGLTGVVEQITVSDQAPLVNATTTELGVVIERRKIAQLPLNGRNYQVLVALQPGVFFRPATTVGGRGGVEFNGAPSFGNNLMLDGIDVSFGEHNGPGQDTGLGGGSVINSVSIEGLEEFKTSSSAFSAEYGRATGGVINLVSKSGTNQFHGTLFEFFRNDALDSNTFDNNRRNVKKNPLRYNQFGGNIGGPVRKNQLFFFFNYEGLRRTQTIGQSGNIPTDLLISSVNPVIRKHLEGMARTCAAPIAADPFRCSHFRTDSRTNNENTYLTRGDYQMNDKHRVSMRYNHVRQLFKQPGSAVRPTNRQEFPTFTHNALVQENWTIGPSLFNELRAGYSRYFLDRKNSTLDTEPGWVEVPGLLQADFQSRLKTVSNTYQLADNMTHIRGSHTFKFGFDLRDVRNARTQSTNPTHTYNSIADLIADRSRDVRVTPGNPGRGYTSMQTGFYFQDDWKVSRRLQLNLGLRYEYFSPLKGSFALQSRNFLGPFRPKGSAMYEPDRNNFGPRIGMVYSLTSDRKTILRAGSAVMYGPQQAFFYYDFPHIDPRVPFNTFLTPADAARSGLSVAFPFPNSFTSAIAANPSLVPASLAISRATVDPFRRDEYVTHWNLSIQREITKAFAIQGTYSGSRGINLLNTTVQNLFRPGTTTRIDPSIAQVTFVESSGRHTYNSFQFSSNYRTGRGSADFYYTFAKNLTYGASDQSDGPRNFDVQDFQNIAGSYGPKPGDIRHHVVAVYTYQLPAPGFAGTNGLAKAVFGGWNLQGIMDWRTGVSLNVLANIDLPKLGQSTPWGYRPDYVAGQNISAQGRPVPAGAAYQFATKVWLNPDAFDVATPYNQNRFGNLGYNVGRGPNSWTFDASLIKQFRVAETHQFEFRAEFFNFFNHPNDNIPDRNAGILTAGRPAKNPNFGIIFGKSGNRDIQLGMKYRF